VILGGYSFPATGGVVPPGLPGHSPGIGLLCDPGQARQLLAGAGYPGGRGFPVVEALVPDDRVRQSEFLRAQWRENLGVEILWEAMEWATYIDRVQVDPPHMFIMGWEADYPDPDNFLRVAVQLHSEWRNETFDELVEQARRVTEQRERMKLYGQAEEILVDEAPLMPLTYVRGHLLVKPWVRRYPKSAVRDCWKDVIIESH